VVICLIDENNASVPHSIILLDSFLQNIKIGVLISPPQEGTASNIPAVTLENLGLRFVDQTVADTTGASIEAQPRGTGELRHWVMGSKYKDTERYRANGTYSEHPRAASLLVGNQCRMTVCRPS
jgi:hypothetical protein